MKKVLSVIAGLAMVGGVAGCAAKSTEGSAPAAAAAKVAAPASSPLSKVQLGMTKRQVKEILGAPTDENSYSTGKMWIPWYFGNDARRVSYFYKGVGAVVFADGNVFGGGGAGEVVRVDYNPEETGVARDQ